jgi:hypothetical protein
MKEEPNQRIYKKKCEFCGKEFHSFSKKQSDWNYVMHIGSCKKKFMKDNAQEEEE